MLKIEDQKEFVKLLFDYCESKNYSILDIEFDNESAKVKDNNYDDIFSICFDKTDLTFKECEIYDFDWDI